MKILNSLFFLALLLFSQSLCALADQKSRVLILTDIEADPDDTQSMVRLLLYSNVIAIEGIVATTSCWKKTSIAPKSITKVIRAYGTVLPVLKQHEDGFPEIRLPPRVR